MTELYDRLTDDDRVDSLIRKGSHSAPIATRRGSRNANPVRLAPRDGAAQHLPMADGAQSTQGFAASRNDRLSAYRPLDSVWHGEEDAELLEQLLAFYPDQEPHLILDATINGARFWRGSNRPVVGLDIDPHHHPAVCGNNAAMPFRDGAFDVVVYDPPHIPNQGRDRQKDFNTRFGLGARSAKEHGYSFSHTFPAFMAEACRVLVDEGLLLCKIVDYVHNHRYQWAHVDLIRAGQDAGLTACDCIIKVRKGPIIDPKWKTAHHSRRQHAYWIIFRKSSRCE